MASFHPSGRMMIETTYSAMLQEYLVAQFDKEKIGRYDEGVIVLVAGDAALVPEHLDAINAFSKHIRASLISHDTEPREDLVEMLFSEYPEYVAARGAALWQRRRMEPPSPEFLEAERIWNEGWGIWDDGWDDGWDDEGEHAHVEL